MSKMRFAVPLAAVMCAVMAPAAKAQILDDVNVDGVVLDGLTLSVATPSAITLFPGQTNTAVAAATVVSTSTSWTLSVKESGTAGYPSGHTAGHMARLDSCVLGDFTDPLQELDNPLAWDATAVGGNSGTLTASNQTVKTGTLVEAVPVVYTQTIDADEDLTSLDCYRATLTYTAA